MIPVSIVTGFLGSGKTTLIRRVLRDPAFARTAVIVNEFGEIGLDHELIAHGDERFLALTTGCLCCAVRSDLVETLLELRRTMPDRYDRVLIETSGLADPAPILHALMTDAAVREAHGIDGLVTVIDPVHGAAALDGHPEARRQAALADLLLFSKTDLGPVPDAIRARIDALNPTAPRGEARFAAPASLFLGADPASRAARLAGLAGPGSGVPSASPPPGRHGAPPDFARAAHSAGIETMSLRRPRPLPALALTLWLQALTEHCGDRLLRVKGLVSIEEMPGQPALLHGVGHVFEAPEFLDAWPAADTETRMVFIYRDIPRYFPVRLLDAIEEEVRDESAERRSGGAWREDC